MSLLRGLMAAVALPSLLVVVGCPSSGPNGRSSPASTTPRASSASQPASAPASGPASSGKDLRGGTELAPEPEPGLEIATFAGGCFWCMEPPFEKLEGVKMVLSGYTGGRERHPSYKDVAYGKTGHVESVRVYFDPDFVTYQELLDAFWMSIDPTDDGGQFADRGNHYRTGIFYHGPMQKGLAQASKTALDDKKKFPKPVVTSIVAASDFWVAEAYHQDYYKKNPDHYNRYRRGSGRGPFLEKHWGTK